MLNEEHLTSVHRWATRGAELASASLQKLHTSDSGLEVREVRATTLGELPERLFCYDGECVAGVACRFEGGLFGTSLLAMDPEDALAWVRSKPDAKDPIESFVCLGDTVQSNIAVEIAGGLGIEMHTVGSELREDSVPLILFGTHAPSDAVVVAISLIVAAGDQVLPVHLYMMVESKVLDTALAA